MKNKYTDMQKIHYEAEAAKWSLDNRDPVVGGFDQHNAWPDYDEYIFKDVPNTQDKVCLDFGCGPGRNLIKFQNNFKSIHGVDIAEKNLEKADVYLRSKSDDLSKHKLFLTNGYDLSNIESNSYDVVMSTICFQHICVWQIRYNLLKEVFRVLKPGGYITMQMGFGPQVDTKKSVGYRENYHDAEGTNGQMDTRVEDATDVQSDLYDVGFNNFKHYIRETGPGDGHPNWIFFNAKKN